MVHSVPSSKLKRSIWSPKSLVSVLTTRSMPLPPSTRNSSVAAFSKATDQRTAAGVTPSSRTTSVEPAPLSSMVSRPSSARQV